PETALKIAAKLYESKHDSFYVYEIKQPSIKSKDFQAKDFQKVVSFLKKATNKREGYCCLGMTCFGTSTS
ncbi:hypothetical protein CU098_004113, partial [Rhizopus stolonifer]